MDTPGVSIRKIVVLGGGSAGFLSALGIAKRLPGVELVVVRSTKMGVIGVGEGTIPSVVQFLHNFLGIEIGTFTRQVNASIKLGIKYLWGKRPFFHYTFSPQLDQRHPWFPIAKGYFCQDDFEFADLNSALMRYDKVSLRARDGRPQMNQNFAYHLENRHLVEFFEKLSDEMAIRKIDAVVQSVEEGPQGIAALHLDDGRRIEGDLFIDCSGFRAELIGKTLGEPFVDFSNALFCDRAVVGGWARSEDDVYHPYTTAETMDAGWAWKIEHDEIVNRGYVFCSRFLSDEQAVEEFCRKNPKIESPRVIRFRAGVHRRTWVKNVVAIGNAAGFVEPIEATAIGVICDSVSRLVRGLSASNLGLLDIQRTIFNRIVFKNWEIIRDFIAVHYRFNDRLETPFWEHCLNEVDLGEAQELVDYYREVGPDFGFLRVELKRDFFTAEGYLAMLLGQRVQYNRKVEIDDAMRRKWAEFRQRLTKAVGTGLGMTEYLTALRSLGNGESAGRHVGQRPPAPLYAEEKASGELNWH
jgi:tryptophan halogenase